MTPEPGVETSDRRATVALVAVVLLSLVVLFSPRAPGAGGIGLDKLVHASLFALLAATTWWRFAGHRYGFAAVLGYAALSEVAQAVLLATRNGEVINGQLHLEAYRYLGRTQVPVIFIDSLTTAPGPSPKG